MEQEAQPGYHTTGRSAALFFESYGNATIRKITTASRAFLEFPPDGFTELPLLSPRGAITLATEALEDSLDTGSGVNQNTADSSQALVLEGQALLDTCPFINPDVIVRGLLEPEAMDMDVHAILHGFLRGMRAKGGRVVTDAEVIALHNTAGVWRVESRAGVFEAPVVINAAGAWCDTLAGLASVPAVGLIPKRRTAFTFDIQDGIGGTPDAWPLAVAVDESWYVKPDAGRMMGSLADETPSPPCDAQPEDLDVAIAIDRIERHTRFRIPRPASRWAGLRSFVADKSPVVGFDPTTDGFFWLAGQGGYGIQTSAGMGRLSAALVLGKPMPEDMAALGLTLNELAPDREGLARG